MEIDCILSFCAWVYVAHLVLHMASCFLDDGILPYFCPVVHHIPPFPLFPRSSEYSVRIDVEKPVLHDLRPKYGCDPIMTDR